MKIGPTAPLRPESAKPARAAHGPRSFLEVLGEQSGPPAGAPKSALPTRSKPIPTASTPAAPTSAPSPLVRGVARALQSAAKGEARLDAILDAAARGKTFTPAELLAMQATVFRYSQTVEVLSRATDRLVGAVKQTLGTQV